MVRVADCMIWPVIPQPTEWQHIGNQIDAAFIFVQPTPVGLMRPKGSAKRYPLEYVRWVKAGVGLFFPGAPPFQGKKLQSHERQTPAQRQY
jgi:hypothetical protein